MESNTIPYRSCSNGGHITSCKQHENSRRCKQHENSRRCKEVQSTAWQVQCMWQPARGKPGHQKFKQPCGYCGQVGTHPKGKTILHTERDVQNARDSITFQQHAELIPQETTRKLNSTNLNGGNQRYRNRSITSKEPLKSYQTAQQALTMSFSARHLKQVKKDQIR